MTVKTVTDLIIAYTLEIVATVLVVAFLLMILYRSLRWMWRTALADPDRDDDE